MFRRSQFLLAICTLILCSLHGQAQEPATEGTRYATGMVFNEQTYRSIPYKAPVTEETYANLPPSVSLEKYCPTPGNQGPHGTCTAFASAYHMRTMLYAIEHGLTSKAQINANIFSPSFIYEQIRLVTPDPNCKEGTDIAQALQLMLTVGAAKIKDVPYQCSIGIDSNDMLKATEFPLVDYQVLFYVNNKPDNEFKVRSIKKALSEGSPVLIGFTVYPSFHRRGHSVWTRQPGDLEASDSHGAHAMAIVGYDDNKHGGAFRIINSWGTGWGDGGYIWVPYEHFAPACFAAIQAYGKQPKAQPYQKNTIRPPEIPLLLAGSVAFQERDGTPMPAIKIVEDGKSASGNRYQGYRLARAYQSGTRFRFFVTTNSRAYLYAFATDLTGKITKILPFDDNMSPMIGRDSTIAFPSERKVIRMDNEPGTDYLLMLYSDEPLNVPSLIESIESKTGTLSVKVNQALGPRLIDQKYIKYDSDGIGFAVQENTRGHVVPLMVEILHN
ncbi:C1 family peptidase [Coraliomargarita sp. SDUM461004]|uniref:C1 family peptidase n=1 Tax=Thalassobacterium sedimentorum TaxID=3041258 RepID=A0ABU1AES3_9BACT|nr:C1 family peptidase [Coraliomargarita sp. SDUM461004]MDQ8193261.1 C1 family peptidase [Coraliomargarita sp. SDUM461004]